MSISWSHDTFLIPTCLIDTVFTIYIFLRIVLNKNILKETLPTNKCLTKSIQYIFSKGILL